LPLSRRVLALAALSCACGSAAPPPPEAPALPPLPPLALLVPRGAELVVVAKPSVLARAPAVMEVVDAVAPPALLDAFARRTGVEPDEVSEAVVAEMGEGLVLIARGPFPARDVVRGQEVRMSPIEVRQEEPFFRRVGWIGTDRVDLCALADDVVLVVRNAPEVAIAIQDRARRGRWSEGRGSALAGEDASVLVAEHEGAPLVVHAPEPLDLPPGTGTALLLARERALAVSVAPADDRESLDFRVGLRGEFPPGAEDNFRALAESVSESDLGMAMGMGESLPSLRIRVEAEAVELTFRIRARSLSIGLRVLFSGEIRELLGERPAEGKRL
jgi:hypothetical protein